MAAHEGPLPPLPDLPDTEALLLTPSDSRFARYEAAFNRRTMLPPKLRVLCKTPGAVATVLEWLRFYRIPFALRSGGHCFEGFSQSGSVVVDTRLMKVVEIDAATGTVTTGPGASLGSLYKAASAHGYALPAGTCPTVGIAGHALGGGSGYLSRQFGFLCDTLQSIEYIDSNGRVVIGDAAQNKDLFWASRGGGGGSLGRRDLFSFSAVSPAQGGCLYNGMVTSRRSGADDRQGLAGLGASGARSHLLHPDHRPRSARSHLARMRWTVRGVRRPIAARASRTTKAEASAYRTSHQTNVLLGAVNHFSEGLSYQSIYAKSKSDILLTPLCEEGIAVLFERVQHLPKDEFTVVMYAYGGAIAGMSPSATAFPYRDALGCIQYALSWDKPDKTHMRLLQLRNLYNSMRPYVSGGAYVNYCDTELKNWREAYWGPNLSRLEAIKSRLDPEIFFATPRAFSHGPSRL